MNARRWARVAVGALVAPLVVVVGPAGAARAETGTAAAVLDGLVVSSPQPAGYDRSEFGDGWADADGDGCDTRSEVLQTESAVPVTFSSGCTVATGQWTSPYDGVTWTDASDVDIDHMVPVAEAWASGARDWTDEQRVAYYNDLDLPDALIAVTDNVNQSKGDSDPSQWLPPLTSYDCTYATNWVVIKYKWNLSIDPAEKTALESLLSGSCGSTPIELPERAGTPDPTTTWPLFIVPYTGTIYELIDGINPVALSFQRWQDTYHFQSPVRAPTSYVRYPWSPTLYGVTFWPGGEAAWQWDRLTYAQWSSVGFPAPQIAGWIKGSAYYQWSTSPELFVLGEDGVRHKLTYAEWQASGFRSFTTNANVGYQKLTWYAGIGFMNNVAAGQGGVIDGGQWGAAAYPTPQQVTRFPGDQFFQNYGNPTIYYAGPLLYGPVTYAQWAAAGFPRPDVHGTPPPPTVPPNPGNSKNCSDFATQAAAQAWFNFYYPYYGDVALLDSDNDRIACESLP